MYVQIWWIRRNTEWINNKPAKTIKEDPKGKSKHPKRFFQENKWDSVSKEIVDHWSSGQET